MRIGAFISGCAGAALSADEQAFFRCANPFGLILFKRNCQAPDQVTALTAAFRRAVGRRKAPVFIDQEGGRVQRLGPPSNAWRSYPPARRYGDLFERAPLAGLRAARQVGRLMAADLIELGITADCLPVLDVPQAHAHAVIGDRAYGLTPERVIMLARAHMAGFAQGGVLPVIKHVPGHGRALADSHLGLPIVDAPLGDLEAVDFPPFAACADAPMAMTAHVVYMALDPEQPATLSGKVIGAVVRGAIGFNGLLMTDDLSMKALAGGLAEKTGRALAAGCDVALHCNGRLEEMEEVAAAAGPLRGAALARARAALEWAGRPQGFDRAAALKDLDLLEAA